ncbi:MAG: YidC/Oxa1 family rane protein insertase [Acidimicrobiaceae bacterium]|jgi:YidC/Oxa1 family membrane protein insertase
MFGLIAQVLQFFYSLIPNYAIAIAMLTLAVMLILTPLTLKGTRSMMMMQIVQPELKKLQAQYKDDRQKLNEEMMKFYKENNINPLSGCLPLLVQMPVFLVLYRVLHGLTTIKDNVDVTVDGVTRHIDHGFVPDYLDKGSELFKSLVGKTEMKAFGIDLATSASNAVSKGIGHALPYLILVVGVCLTSIVQQKQISGRNPAAQSNPQQQLLMKLGPIMITFFSLIVPAGLAVYFFVSNLYRVAQQELISRTIYRSPEAKKLQELQAKEHADKKAKGGAEPKGFFAKLLGDAAPQMPDRKPRGSNGSAKPAAGKNGSDGGSGTTKPPATASGRATPPGSRSAASRKKKKRK